MSEEAIDSENTSEPTPDTPRSKVTRKAGKKARSPKKPNRAK